MSKTKNHKRDPSKNAKLSSMKTATDVISRLLWDDSLPPEKFSVGYLDRFDGIVEKPFTSLDWNDPAIVDNHTLALPKHRIQYFKYLSRKVWDKRNRTDIIFGSTGYPISIHEFISKVDSNILDFHDEGIDSDTSLEQHNATSLRCIAAAKDIEDYDVSDRPNFFIAARIKDEKVVARLKEVSDYIKSKDELLGECCIPHHMFHLTLSILNLRSPGEVNDAVSALKALSLQNLPPISISLSGLDNFKLRVLYARVDENENLLELRTHLIQELVSRNLTITDRFSFVPHVTVTKLSRTVAKLRNSKYIDQYLYLGFEDNVFGSEKVDKLYLCEIGAARGEDGFYKCACEITLNS